MFLYPLVLTTLSVKETRSIPREIDTNVLETANDHLVEKKKTFISAAFKTDTSNDVSARLSLQMPTSRFS